MQKRWVIKEKGEPGLVKQLMDGLNINEKLAQLLLQRDVKSFEDAKSFFRPELEDLHDPFLMKDMGKAIERLELAIQNGERIMVYGDYDVDGTTAVALMYSFIKELHENVDYYIPDRYLEGYGISFAGIDYAKETGVTLIVALDCGIKSNDKIDYANERGIDFIICDHHLPGETIPEAVAVLDPKRTDCTYPFKELCGCGIGFKLAQAYSQKNNIPFENLHKYLDLAVISIASDVVPIVDENRILAYYGLEQVNTKPRPGVKSLLEFHKVKHAMNISNLVFVVGPRINAAGRISSGKKAVEMLISESMELAAVTGKLINEDNDKRKGIDKTITAEALEMIGSDEALINKKTTVLFHESWHKGVVGIVASRLTDTYYRPTILLAESNGKATGSARSVQDFDVYHAIEQCSELLEQFGGHKYAAGLTIKKENIEAFSNKFEKIVSGLITEEMLIKPIDIDLEVDFAELTDKFYRIMKQMSPFGPGNMNPVFVTRGVKNKWPARLMKEDHLRLELIQPGNPNFIFSAIGFNMKNLFDMVSTGQPFDVCYSIEENHYNGKTTLQLNLKDIRIN
ncbi:MAG: single-stranded-DNA-specific exonuclease RecJ [Bacteroidetes bacterium]|nr:single-stranded-DNA-specific exonuclease RecJ [Bacteroidota bacterium]